MCGIAGAAAFEPERAHAAVRAMVHAQRHRGPDDQGIEQVQPSGPTVVLGHRRLSVIDVSPAGHQPMRLPDRNVWLSFNGEIYNYRQLREELRYLGVEFGGDSDSEVLLKAYGKWGTRAFARLNGIFAFAIYDGPQQALFLVRDGMGIKPLYFHAEKSSLCFASEVKALEQSALFEPELDPASLATVLAYGAIVSPRTILRGTREVEPGTFLRFDLSPGEAGIPVPAVERYWSFIRPEPVRLSDANRLLELRSLLAQAVADQMVSDVPVGIFLSSGVDSSALAYLAGKARDGDVDTFTVGFGEGEAIDESADAARTAARLGVRHHDIQLSGPALLSCAAAWMQRIDQPGIDGLNTFIIAKAVRERGVTVALSGLGGDELFGGYPSFRQVPRLHQLARIGRLIPSRWRGGAVRALLSRTGDYQRQKAIELAEGPGSLSDLYLTRRRLLSDRDMAALGLSAEAQGLPRDFIAERPAFLRESETLAGARAVQAMESMFYMRNTLLRDSDVFGMAHALEIRVPLLDRRVVEMAAQLTAGQIVARGRPNKPLLAALVAAEVPPNVVNAPKRGFSLPYARWMTGPLLSLFEDNIAVLRGSGRVDPRGVDRIWNGFKANPEGTGWSRAWVLGVVGAWLSQRASRATADS